MLSPAQTPSSDDSSAGHSMGVADGPSLGRSVIHGGIAFAIVSTAAFAVWAFGGPWFRGRGGEVAMYGAIALVFMALSGLALHPLIQGPGRLSRFYVDFVPAFLAYAVVWSAFWFWLGGGAGEWLGALLGSLAFVGLTAWRWKAGKGVLLAAVVFFIAHTAGYFAGGQTMAHFIGAGRSEPAGSAARDRWYLLAKLSWGVCYGLGFGAGLGFTYHTLQNAVARRTPPPPEPTIN